MSEVKDIKKLRQLTGAGFTDCSVALKDSKGDIDKAIDMGRKMGVHVSADLPHIWRKPKAKFALPPKGESATVDHLKKLAMMQMYYPESRKP